MKFNLVKRIFKKQQQQERRRATKRTCCSLYLRSTPRKHVPLTFTAKTQEKKQTQTQKQKVEFLLKTKVEFAKLRRRLVDFFNENFKGFKVLRFYGFKGIILDRNDGPIYGDYILDTPEILYTT